MVENSRMIIIIIICAIVWGGVAFITTVCMGIRDLCTFTKSPPTHTISYEHDKPWNIPNCLENSNDEQLEVLNELEYLRLEIDNLNELREIVLEKYVREETKKEVNLRKLIIIDNSIHTIEKKIRKLE